MILEINPQNPQPRRIQQVVEVLRQGGVVAYPTDTVYGLGCDIFNKKAIKRIHQLKRQPLTRPFSFICPGLTELSQYARVTNYAYKTLRRLLPGPYTFILEGSRQVPKMMLTRRKNVGIRVPDHPICLAIVQELGHPVISTSAIDSQGRQLTSPRELEEVWGRQLEMVVDGGPVSGLLSSVVSLVDDAPEVLREGAGTVDEFR
ncbi:MAG: L-threonylcarbamoyladenylate synthase, partial [Desulfarculaceae bacterium]|jgi:tRNA threonylcarbamoyl adenosine modification protein (Sua5/YciO/YrdC/YwlC family)